MIRCGGIVLGGVLLLALVLPACGLAQTAPATRTATPLDLSTPRSAAKSLFEALTAGDRDAVRSILYADDPAQRELAGALADLIVNGKRLGDAAKQKFGADSDPIARGMLDPADLAQLDSAQVTETGDTATVALPQSHQNRPMTFRREQKQWKLVVTDFAGAAPGNIAKQVRLIRMMASAMDESARDISAGKYKTADDAVGGIQRRLHEVMLTFTRPATTRAATNPSTAQTPP